MCLHLIHFFLLFCYIGPQIIHLAFLLSLVVGAIYRISQMAALTSAVTQMSFGTGRYLEKLKLLDLEEKDDPYEASNHQLRITG